MRIYALYRRKKFVLRLMIGCFIACSITAALLMGTGNRTLRASPIDLPHGRFCLVDSVDNSLFAFWIPILSFESLLFGLAFVHGYREYMHGWRDTEVFKVFDTRRLSNILVQDSILYFLAVGSVYLAYLVLWITEHSTLLEAVSAFSVVLSSALGSRLILHLREADERQFSNSPSEMEVSQLVFPDSSEIST